jgi:asparagine synthase (glutamine-hydrolysing)
MSGIAGLSCLDERPGATDGVERMLKCLARRGPDLQGSWQGRAIGLGARVAATSSAFAGEPFPAVQHRGPFVLVADARIDNRAELMAALRCEQPSKRAISDGELILAAFDHWGEHCTERLLGDFAFAVWDTRKETLFCARDHFGVRPFYFHHRPGHLFAFASEIKALLALLDDLGQPNEEWIGEFLVGLQTDPGSTSYRDIVRLRAGHALSVTRNAIHQRAYWSLTAVDEVPSLSEEEEAEGFREVFAEAVRCRLRGIPPIAACLSGGLDSSSVVCVARDLMGGSGHQLVAFSGRAQDPQKCRESPYIDAILRGNGIVSHTVRPGHITSLTLPLGSEVWAGDEPSDALTPVLQRTIFRAVGQQGIRVLLDGVDGDFTTSLSLDDYVPALLRHGQWRTLLTVVAGVAQVLGRSQWRVFLAHTMSFVRSYPCAWLVRQHLRKRWINPKFSRRLCLAGRLLAEQSEKSRGSVREVQLRRLAAGTIPLGLEMLNRAAAAHSVELRHPFFDRRVVEFCLARPPANLVRGGWPKRIVREAMRGLVSEEVRWRTDRASVQAEFARAFVASERPFIEDVLTSGLDLVRDYIDVASFRSDLRRLADHGPIATMMAAWEVVALAVWLRGVTEHSEPAIAR